MSNEQELLFFPSSKMFWENICRVIIHKAISLNPITSDLGKVSKHADWHSQLYLDSNVQGTKRFLRNHTFLALQKLLFFHIILHVLLQTCKHFAHNLVCIYIHLQFNPIQSFQVRPYPV